MLSWSTSMKPCRLCKPNQNRNVHLRQLPWLLALVYILMAPVCLAANADSGQWLAIAQRAEARKAGHYMRTSLFMAPLHTETVTDEIWRDGQGRWRLERRSATWDNGLVALSDGRYITVSVPYMSEVLRVSSPHISFAGTPRSIIAPELFNSAVADIGFNLIQETNLDGRAAIVLIRRSGGLETKRWVDKSTGLPLREERYNKDGQPVLIVVREDLPADKPPAYSMVAKSTTTDQRAWQQQAIVAWLASQLVSAPPMSPRLPSGCTIEWVQSQGISTGTQVMLLVNCGGELVSLWLSPADNPRFTNRPLLTKGQTVIARRIGHYEVVAVASSERYALRVLSAFFD